jgi:hypothetical protein
MLCRPLLEARTIGFFGHLAVVYLGVDVLEDVRRMTSVLAAAILTDSIPDVLVRVPNCFLDSIAMID